ncbi:MAG: sugar transferase [Bacillota bacterium]
MSGDGVRVSPYALSPLKRAFDILLSSLGLLLAVPLWVLVPLAILLDDGRPVFYAQARVGRGGRVFRVYKFRSMVRDAEQRSGPVLAGADDPRVTRVGRLLRATALDELPQLVNILLGHMSFVGPRPERPELVAEIAAACPRYELRHLIRPGLTGLAQILGHYASPPEEKLEHDLAYIREACFRGDLKVILQSFGITFSGKWQERSGHVRRRASG